MRKKQNDYPHFEIFLKFLISYLVITLVFTFPMLLLYRTAMRNAKESVVKDSYGLNIPGTQVRGGIYKVDDGTGSIWVVTNDAVPGKGAEIGVEGRIGSGLNWNGKNYGLGMYEKQRKFRKR